MNDLDKLIKVIHNPGVYCFPRKILEYGTDDDFSLFDKIGLTNNLIVYKEEKHFDLKSSLDILFIMNKSQSLSSNIFEILKMRKDLDPESFSFFLKKYLNTIVLWLKVVKLTRDEAKECATNYSPELQRLLNIQYDNLIYHQKELHGYIIKWHKGSKDVGSIHTRKEINQGQKTTELNLSELAIKDKPSSKHNKKENKPLPSIAEVDQFILSKVFNIATENN